VESRVPARLIDINYSHEDSVETKRATTTASTTTSGCRHSTMYTDTPDGSLPYLFDSETAVQKDYFSHKIFCLSLSFGFPLDLFSILSRILHIY
jgi:hypothetical protein